MIIRFKQAILLATAVFLGVTAIPQPTLGWGFGDMFGVDGINTIGTKEKQEDSLLHTVQTAINRVLGILATISLCLVLYAGFLMMTSGGDSKKYDQGLSIIKNAAIGLAIIAVSWLIVSLIFYIINGSTNPNINPE